MDHVAGLTKENRKLALDRFRLIQPHLGQDQSLQAVADAAGVRIEPRNAWVAQYRLFGLVALVCFYLYSYAYLYIAIYAKESQR